MDFLNRLHRKSKFPASPLTSALLTMAAYIDLNPVRAGLAADPKDYRYSSYGAAMGGCKEARAGLQRLMQAALGHDVRTSWGKTQRAYRQRLYIRANRGA
jgi:putative transposase